MALTQVDGNLLASGGVTPTQLNTQAQYTGFKNRIINGAMMIDQRNAGAAVNLTATTGLYTVDRWFGYSNSTASGTLTAQQISSSYPYKLRVSRSAGTYTGGLTVGQVIETKNLLDLAGQTITLSFQMAAGSAFSAGTVRAWIWAGTAADQGMAGIFNGNWTGMTNTSLVVTPTTTTTTYTVSYAVPSNVQEIGISFTSGSFSGTGSANDYFEISNVQLEKGSTATSFDYRPYGTELALCQRYYEKCYDQGTVPGTNVASGVGQVIFGGSTNQGGNIQVPITFKVTKRTAPTMTGYTNTGTSGQWGYNNIGGGGTAACTLDSIGDSGCRIYLGAGVTWGSANCNGYWVASSEL